MLLRVISLVLVYLLRLVLDTNVLVAAFRSDRGACRKLLLAGLDRKVQILVSVPVLIEYESVLSRPEPALYHAQLTHDICTEHAIGDFDLAYAFEALARAHAVAGNRGESDGWRDRARAATADVADAEDRELLLGDLATIPA